MKTPRLTTDPPNEEDDVGLWILDYLGNRRVYHFVLSRWRTGDRLECSLPGMSHSPRTMHHLGCVWYGPLPVPQIPDKFA